MSSGKEASSISGTESVRADCSKDITDTIEFKPTGYSSDLTDSQWLKIAEFFPQIPNSKHHKRSLINAVLYRQKNGTKWRKLPSEYPNWQTVHSFYFRARKSGLWEKVQHAITENSKE
jgi:putative transposase